MSTNDKLILLFLFAGMLITFAAILGIVIDKYKKAEQEKKEDELADAEEINQKILQMHDYGEFLSKELSNKQSEAMLMYEMLLDKEKSLQDKIPTSKNPEPVAKAADFAEKIRQDEKNPFDFMAEPVEDKNKVIPSDSQSRQTVTKKPDTVTAEEANGDNYNQQILKLYAEGMNAEEIAKRLQIGKGQTELVIRLFARG